MRNHGALSARLRGRWMRAARPLRGVNRVFAAAAAPRFMSVRHLHAHTHVAFATALNAPRTFHHVHAHTHVAFATALTSRTFHHVHAHTHVAFATALTSRTFDTIVHTPVAGATRTVIEDNIHGDEMRPPVPDRSPRIRTLQPTLIAVQRVLASERRERTVVTGRQETHVASIACVVPEPGAVRGPADEVARPVATRAQPPAPWAPPHTISPLGGPTPVQLATITNHVLTAIDRRLIAHNERLGRG